VFRELSPLAKQRLNSAETGLTENYDQQGTVVYNNQRSTGGVLERLTQLAFCL
jgi:hypothetical protein